MDRRWWVAPLATIACLAGTTAAAVAAGILFAAWMLTSGSMPTGDDPLAAAGQVPPLALGVMLLVQFAGFPPVAIATVLALGPGSLRDRLARGFPVRTHPGWLAAAVAIGATVSHLPGWVADRIGDALGIHALIGDILPRDPFAPEALLATASVVILGPVAEELVFRGALWRAWVPRGRALALVVTSVLFGLYHLDPLQAFWATWIALALGWLRMRSGSIAPPIVAHVTNNALATVLPLLGETPPWFDLVFSLGTAAAALAVMGIGSRLPARTEVVA